MYVLPGDSKAYAHCSWPFDGTPSPDDSSIGAVAAAGVIRTAVDFIPVRAVDRPWNVPTKGALRQKSKRS